MASVVEICNMALSHLGISQGISNFETEKSSEAAACRLFYTIAKEATLRDFNWPFAVKIAALSLVEEDPNDEWSYSYRYPVNCLNAVRILSGVRNETKTTYIPYKIVYDSTGSLIYCDQEDAELEYIYNITDPTHFTSDFVIALSYRLASYLAARLTKGDPFQLQAKVLKLYEYEVSRTKATALNEQKYDAEPEAGSITARD